MSGLVGFIFGRAQRPPETYVQIRTAFERMMILAESRGSSASGIAVLRRCGGHSLFKRPVSAHRLVTEPPYIGEVRRVLDRIGDSTTLLMGHARDAEGADPVNPRNNEPIRACQVLGSHDGSIAEPESLSELWGLSTGSENDGEPLYRLADSLFADGSLSVSNLLARISEVEGYFASAFASKSATTAAYLLRAGAPLEAWIHPQLRVVGYASDRSALESVLPQTDGWTPMPFPDGHLMTISTAGGPDFTLRSLHGAPQEMA